MLCGIRPFRISYWLRSSSSLFSSGLKTFIRRMKVSIMFCCSSEEAEAIFIMSIMPVASMVVEGFTCIIMPWSVR